MTCFDMENSKMKHYDVDTVKFLGFHVPVSILCIDFCKIMCMISFYTFDILITH